MSLYSKTPCCVHDRSFEEDDDDSPPAKRSRRSTARAMESAELEAMDVFGDKEDEEDRW